MQTKLLSWIMLLGLMTVFAGEAAAQGTPPAQTDVAHITAARVRGEVSAMVKATGVRTKVTDNMALAQGSVVTTSKGASVVLIFSNGATINLGTDTVLDIETFTQDPFATAFSPGKDKEEPSKSVTKMTLTRGELVGQVAKLKKDQGSTFDINTPVGAAGIRGTTFRIVYRPDGTGKAFFSLTTLEGNVQVTLATGSVPVPVSVTDNKEVVLADVTINVDTSGKVTITTPAGTTVIPTDAPVTSTQAIVAAVQQIAEAVAAAVIPSTTSNNNTNGNQNGSPGTTATNTRTTTGDGSTQ